MPERRSSHSCFATALCLALCLSLTAMAASASAQGLSTFSKRGTDAQNGSTATAGGAAGTTAAGNTIDWVLSYRNTSGATANVNIADPITGNQAFVGGSLRTPPGLAPRWSTDGGATYVDTEPGAGVNAVGAAGTSIDGSTGLEDLFSPPIRSFSAGRAAGDGWEVMFIGDNVYNVFHHRGTAIATLDCHVKATGAQCAGFPVEYVSPNAGDAFGTGPDTLLTNTLNNGAYDPATGEIFFASGVSNGTSIGVACANVITRQSCGYTQLATAAIPNVDTGPFGAPGMAGGRQVGSRFYTVATGMLGAPVFCFDMVTKAACAGWPAGGVPSNPAYTVGPGSNPNTGGLEGWGGYLFTNVPRDGTQNLVPKDLGCIVIATATRCPGFPILGYGTTATSSVAMAPLLDSGGNVTGICGADTTAGGAGAFECYSLTGTPQGPAPWGVMAPGSNNSPGGALQIGTRLYLSYTAARLPTYTCYDFATSSPCQGFVPVASGQDVAPYTLRQDPQNPDCIWELGDSGVFEVFSATFGGQIGCNVGNAQVQLTPAEFYCDGQPGHVAGWDQLRIGGVTAADYEAIAITITDANGDPVPGWTNRIVDSADVPVDISSIPHSGPTTTLNVAVVINWGQNAARPATASATFEGDPVQVCFRTTVGPPDCVNAQNIDNAATAVTAVPGGPSDGPGGNSSGTARFTLPAQPELCPADVEIEKSTSGPVVPGEEATYSLRVTNHGPHPARELVVSDPLPAGLTFVSAGEGCSEAGGTITCTLAGLAVGASHTFTFTATVDAAAEDCEALRNTATVGTASFDPDLSNNTSTICNFRRRSDLRVTKVASQPEVPTGGQVMYTLVVRNLGPSGNSNVTVTDRLAAGLALVSAQPSQGSCSTDGGRVSCNLGSLRASGSAQVLVTATVTAGSGCIDNTGTVAGDAFDPTRENNRASARVCVGDPPQTAFDLEVDKRVDIRRPRIGQRVTYRIVVRNNGPGAAPDARLTDTYNSRATLVSVRTSQGECVRRLPVTCVLGRIEAGERATITIVIRPRQIGRARNAASATSCCGTDTNPNNNIDRADIRVRPVALRLSKVASDEIVAAGQTFSYRIRVRNPTPGQARNVRLCDRLPSGIRYVSSSPRARASGRRQCWTIRRIGARQSRTFRVTARAASGALGRKVNTATLTSPDIGGRRRLQARDVVRILGVPTPVTG